MLHIRSLFGRLFGRLFSPPGSLSKEHIFFSEKPKKTRFPPRREQTRAPPALFPQRRGRFLLARIGACVAGRPGYHPPMAMEGQLAVEAYGTWSMELPTGGSSGESSWGVTGVLWGHFGGRGFVGGGALEFGGLGRRRQVKGCKPKYGGCSGGGEGESWGGGVVQGG